MASKQKRPPVSDWMYHAPARGTTEVVGAPPPSQIPCLHGNEDLPPPDMPQKNVIKESDSAYIRLAKMGGREDLLRMRSPGPKSEGPVGYPRVDWYYQEDNQDGEEKGAAEDDKDYEFMLPDYMVHKENKNKSEEAYRPNRLPYAQDRISVYEREGSHPNDKTVRIEEAKAAGYGVRKNKTSAASKKSHAPVERTEICKPASPQVGISSKQYKPMPSPKEENIHMGKLLSFGYLDEWRKDRDTWADKQQKYADSHADGKKPERMNTEYREQMMGKGNPTKSAPKASSSQKSVPTESAGSRKTQSETTEDRPDFFKLSKFKNVPSKTSHRRMKGDSENGVAAQ